MTRFRWLRPMVAGLCALPVLGTILSFSRGTHWLFRMWDFPRVQVAVMAAAGAVVHRALTRKPKAFDRGLIASCAAVVAYQLYRINKYMPFAPSTVRRARSEDPANRLVLLP